MRLDRLDLQNYRCFSTLRVDLHPNLTVLIAPNGAGKTTLLDAARVALWPFVKGFDLGSNAGKAPGVDPVDVRLAQQTDGNMEAQVPSSVQAVGAWASDLPIKQWAQFRESVKVRTKTLGDAGAKELGRHAQSMQARVRAGREPVILPLISYLGTSRLWYEGRFSAQAEDRVLDKEDYSRTSGYLNCLSYSSSFKAFTAWFGWVSRAHLESKMKAFFDTGGELDNEGQRFANTVRVVQRAVDELVKNATGWHTLAYSQRYNQQLVMSHPEHGVMPVDMLSDGLRNAIAMVADLAFRAYKLNPHFGAEAALHTPGVALIDEVDMFLHPAWQQTILASLRKAFPMVQFVVSTHSPQVLSTVPSECIRILRDGQVFAAAPGTEGAEAGRLLIEALGLDSQRPSQNLATQELRAYLTLVDQDQWDSPEALALRAKLDTRYQGHEPALLEADMLINNRKWERGE